MPDVACRPGDAGVFITFEGDDGVGKTTQIELLRDWLSAKGREVLCLHEPGGTAIGEKIRALLLGKDQDGMDPLAELLLFEAARAQIVAEQIRPALAVGKVVLCDRFTDSTVAYQGYGRELGAALVAQLNEVATGGLEPDLTILLCMDEAAAQERVLERAGADGGPEIDRMESAGSAFRKRVHQGFVDLAAAHPDRIRVVDAARPIDAIHNELKGIVPFSPSTEVE